MKERKKFWLAPVIIILLLPACGIILAGVFTWLFFINDQYVSGKIMLIGYLAALLIFTAIYLNLIKRKRIVISNIFLLAILLVLLETVCFFLLGMPGYEKKNFAIPAMLIDDHIAMNVGSVPQHDTVIYNTFIDDNDTVGTATYTIDSYSKRFTPGYKKENKKYALFFGCSITFGYALNDNETMPWYFQEKSGEYNSYNFGTMGHSANHMLARFQYTPINEQVTENSGVSFYIFFWDHIRRTTGSMKTYTEWLVNAPYFYLKDGKPVRNKMFKNGRYYLSKVYELIYQLNIIRYFNIDFPLNIRQKHLELVAAIVAESKNEYVKQFGNDNFYLAIYPEWEPPDPEMMSRFKTLLVKKGVKYIDLSGAGYEQNKTLGWDPHPNKQTHATIAELLLIELKKQQQTQ